MHVPELVDDLLRYPFAILLTLHGVGINDLHEEFSDLLLELSVAVRVIRAEISRGKPRRLSVGHSRQVRGRGYNSGFLSLHSANLESFVLRSLKHFLTVQAKEGLGRILTG